MSTPWPHIPAQPSDQGVYVHFPFCEKKCPYCDFNSHVAPHDSVLYADAILRELEARATALDPRPLRSLFFGGGTPSLWDPSEVGRVIKGVQAIFGFSDDTEITLEANPGTIHAGRFEAYRAVGVNRFSIGVQSFLAEELTALGRIHDAAAAERAVRSALATEARVSLDLMYALPGQSWDDVRASLDRALALGPGHISAYTLTVEPDTVLGRRTRLGLFSPMDDDHQADLVDRVSETLMNAGYARYEISNYARPGEEAVHNALYWSGGPYLGLGAGAHSYLPRPRLEGALRRGNIKSPAGYIDAAIRGDFPTFLEEHLDRWPVILDRLWVGLRPRWGIDVTALAAESTLNGALEAHLAPTLETFRARDWVRTDGHRWAPTPTGFLFNDGMARTLLQLDPPGA